jgi:hypothetical protein
LTVIERTQQPLFAPLAFAAKYPSARAAVGAAAVFGLFSG